MGRDVFAPEGGTAAVFGADPPSGAQLIVGATVRHTAYETLTVGVAAQVMCEELGGGPPVGWGTSEPAGISWDLERLTRLCRERAPRPMWLVFVGDAVVGTMTVTRTASGVQEAVTVGLDAGFSLVTVLAQRMPGRADLTAEPRWTGPLTPVGMAIGPEARAETGTGGGTRWVPLDDRPGPEGGPSSPGSRRASRGRRDDPDRAPAARTVHPLTAPEPRQVEAPPTLPEGGGTGAQVMAILPMVGMMGSLTIMTVLRNPAFIGLGAVLLVVAVLAGGALLLSRRGQVGGSAAGSANAIWSTWRSCARSSPSGSGPGGRRRGWWIRRPRRCTTWCAIRRGCGSGGARIRTSCASASGPA